MQFYTTSIPNCGNWTSFIIQIHVFIHKKKNIILTLINYLFYSYSKILVPTYKNNFENFFLM